jgi:hypothetical protein
MSACGFIDNQTSWEFKAMATEDKNVAISGGDMCNRGNGKTIQDILDSVARVFPNIPLNKVGLYSNDDIIFITSNVI